MPQLLRVRTGLALLILATLGASHLSSAQDDLKSTIERLNPTVAFVVTGGEWQRGDDRGEVRIVIASGGFEHVTSVLYVQWLLIDPDSAETRVVRTEQVKEFADRHWSLATPRITWQGQKWYATVDGADSHTEPPRVSRWRMDIGPPGEIHVSLLPRSRS